MKYAIRKDARSSLFMLIDIMLMGMMAFAAPARADSEFLPVPDSTAQREYQRMVRAGDPDASHVRYIAQNAVAKWYTSGSDADVAAQAQAHLDAAAAAGKIAVMVLYNIPHRDCGSYSAGGTEESAYLSWIHAFASALGRAESFVIVEPDALPGADCLDAATRSVRFELLRSAVGILKRAPRTRVYLDAGHPHWLSAEEAVRRLQAAGVDQADGFSLNVSNFIDDPTNIAYGQRVRAQIGKGFVIDSSRNGNGAHPSGEWCNPPGRAVGRPSTLGTGIAGLDAYLWVKIPGESDGNCNGLPPAGHFSLRLALELARNRPHQQQSAVQDMSIGPSAPSGDGPP